MHPNYHHTKSAKPGILFSALYGSAEKAIRDEGRAGKN
jgi:hypothetical protein